MSRFGSEPKFLMFLRTLDMGNSNYEYDVYDFATSAPLGSWRGKDGGCDLRVAVGGGTMTLFGLVVGTGMSVATGTPQDLASRPTFFRVAPAALIGQGIQEVNASDSTVAFDVEPAGTVFRAAVGSAGSQEGKRPHPPLLLQRVEGEDVYGLAEHGTAGWGQFYRVDADGSVVLYRSNPNAHVGVMRTDGTTLFWTETYGTTDVVSSYQTRAEVWAAPYTRDPVQLASTARKLADVVDPILGVPLDAIAFNGLFAFTTNRSHVSWVVRASDGSAKRVDPGASWNFPRLGLTYVTNTELWSLILKPNGEGLARLPLGTW